MKVSLNCKRCNSPFETEARYLKRGRGVYCSRACSTAAATALASANALVDWVRVNKCWFPKRDREHVESLLADMGNAILHREGQLVQRGTKDTEGAGLTWTR